MLEIFIAIGITCVALFISMELTHVEGPFSAPIIISVVSILLLQVPAIGAVLSVIAMFVLIVRLTDAEYFPDAVLMVTVARAVAIFGTAALVGSIS